jgi:HSP20 family protein
MAITDLIPWRHSGRQLRPRSDDADPVHSLQLDVDRAFDNFWRSLSFPFPDFDRLGQTDAVRVDVSDSGKEVTVTAELPGMSEGDIDVRVDDGVLTIRGEKKLDRESKDEGVSVRERVYGMVERTVPLPEGVERKPAKATFKNGVLKVVLPKSKENRTAPKHIAVQAG